MRYLCRGEIYMKSILFIIKENIVNFHRSVTIAKYEIRADIRDTKLGYLWNILNPIIQLFTFWLVFGIGIRNNQSVGHVSFLPWMVVGMTVWFFISPSLTKGVSCIYNKRAIISKMKFPVSILPMTIVLQELFNHVVTLSFILVVLVYRGHIPSLNWLYVIYYALCAFSFCLSLNMITSVLNMFTRDIKKLVLACIRMLMYLTPILWTLDGLLIHFPILANALKLNPLYYVVEGYRGAIFFNDTPFLHPAQTLYFWIVVITMFIIGSVLMYRFRTKFIDML